MSRKPITEQMKPLQDKFNQKMEELKGYYTPSVEEFHIGFEYEPVVNDGRLLFFKDFERAGEKLSCGLLYVPSTNWVLIYSQVKQVEGVLQGNYVLELPENKLSILGGTMFAGTIKNISKLKDVLKTIGVHEG